MSKCELKPCPFCGKEVQMIMTCADDCCDNSSCEGCDYIVYAICCNVNLNGCGASCGYSGTKEEAIEKWNERAENE